MQNGCSGTGCTQAQETYDYNNRLQPVRIQLGTPPNPAANSCLVYNYYVGVSNPTSCAIPSQAASGNNRNEVGHYFQDTTNPSLGHMATYGYDNLNRLTSSVATGSATHNLTFDYDRYGNMTCQTNGQTNGPCPNYTFSSSTNQITNSSFTYDGAGNLKSSDEWRVTSGEQSLRFPGSAPSVLPVPCSLSPVPCPLFLCAGGGEERQQWVNTEYVYDASGEPIGENNRTSWTAEFFDFQGRHLVHYQGEATYFVHPNTVGSTGHRRQEPAVSRRVLEPVQQRQLP